ncbi:MAG: galactose ABC transporter substrate-binding protein [Lachnospiraceae bacterium]
MKKYRFGIIAVCVIGIMIIFGLYVQDRKRTEEPQVVKIGVSVYKANDTFIASIISNLDAIVKEQEKQNHLTIKLDISDGKENQAEQNEQVERYIALDYDVICVNLVDRTNAAALIDRAAMAQIPLIFFNREPVEEDMSRSDQVYYIGSDAKKSAIIQGKIVLDAYHTNPKSIDQNGDGIIEYAMLEGEAGHQDTIIRTEYSVQTLEQGGMNLNKVVGFVANFDRNQAAAALEQWLLTQQDVKLELIISNNDDMALGAADALEKVGKERCAIVGIDGTPMGIEAVQAGRLLGTAVSDAKVYAENIFEVAYACGQGKPIPDTVVMDTDRYVWIPWKSCTKEYQ